MAAKPTSLRKVFPVARRAGFAAVAAFALLRFWDPVPVEIARNFYFDLLQRVGWQRPPGLPVVIIAIDDKSLSEIGQWPWSRAMLAELTRRLAQEEAAVIGFDMIFAEPDRLSPNRLAGFIPESEEHLRRELIGLPENDELFASALRSTKAVLGRGAVSTAPVEGAPALGHPPQNPSFATIGGDPREDLHRYPAALRNLPVLESAASGIGMLTVRPEHDGLIRRAPLLLRVGNEIIPSFVVELIRIARKASSILVKRDAAGVKSIVVAGLEIPADRDGQLWIAFTPHDPNRYISAADVLAGRISHDRIAGKIAIIGTSAAGLSDLKSTPLDRVIPAEIQAQMVESILGGTTLNRPNFALGLEISLAVAIGVMLVVLTPLARALVNLSLSVAVVGAVIAGSFYFFIFDRYLIDVSYPLASSFTVFLLLTFMNYAREEKRRAQVRTAFRQYLSPELVEQLIREPERLVLGGETREMTILFSDVRGFTAIAESFKDNPAGLTSLMNRLLTSLSQPIIQRRGTIDKYIGDAIMAFWNAPLNDSNHALNAGEAALELVRRLEGLNADRRQEALHAGTSVSDMEIGVGIATGLSVVGNMGSDMRFDYSVLGDSVNLASRLESLTALYGVRTLMASETARRCSDRLAIIEIDRVRVKGKQEAEKIYSVLGGADVAAEEQFNLFKDSFQSMLSCYRAQAWEEALRHLAHCKAINYSGQLGTLLEMYSMRITGFLSSPPPPDWDGVFNAHREVSSPTV